MEGVTGPPTALSQEGGLPELLEAAADAARTIFHAKAASVLLVDEVAGELVFEAVSGEGAELLRRQRIPLDAGIAGSVLASGEPAAIQDVGADPRFAAGIAEASGYVPTELMAAPLVRAGRGLGVLEVLDRPQFSRFSLAELDMLALLARQLAISVDLMCRLSDTARTTKPDGSGESSV